MNPKTSKTKKNIKVPQAQCARLSNQTFILDSSCPYKIVRIIGSGTFGAVFEAQDISGKHYSIKKVVQDPRFKNRELEILQQLDHPNCLYLNSFFYTNEGSPAELFLHIVTPVFPMDLSNYVKVFSVPSPVIVKIFSYQMFCAISYLHSLSICHRDIKSRNVLVNPDNGMLTICDFGSAKPISPTEQSVSYIATRSYRAPELLYGATRYGPPVDIWALGCVIAEMLQGLKPLFNGESNSQMIVSIAKVIGAPTDTDMSEMGGDQIFSGRKSKPKTLDSIFKGSDPLLLDLLSKIFVYSPQTRITGIQCVQHPYFNDIREHRILYPNNSVFVPPADEYTNHGKRRVY